MKRKLKKIGMGARMVGYTLISMLIMTPAYVANAQQLQGGLQDPLKFNSIADFVQGVLEAFVVISLPILSFFIIWAGFKYVSARGNSGKNGDAHENFKWLIVGAVLILGAWALAQLIANTVNQIRG